MSHKKKSYSGALQHRNSEEYHFKKMKVESGKQMNWLKLTESLHKAKEEKELLLQAQLLKESLLKEAEAEKLKAEAEKIKKVKAEAEKIKADKEQEIVKASQQKDRLKIMHLSNTAVNEERKAEALKTEEARKAKLLKEEERRKALLLKEEERHQFKLREEEEEHKAKILKEQQRSAEYEDNDQKESDLKECFTLKMAAHLINTYSGAKGWRAEGETDAASLAKFEALNCRATYGELYPSAVETMCQLMEMKSASMFIDAGSGRGKLALQVFFRYPNVKKIVAIELMKSRYDVGVKAMKDLHHDFPMTFSFEESKDGSTVLFSFKGQNRVLEMKNMDLFDLPAQEYQKTDVLLLETAILRNNEMRSKVLMNTKIGCHMLSYQAYENYGKVKVTCGCGHCPTGFHLGMYKSERFLEVGTGTTFHTTWSTEAPFSMAKRLS